MQSESAPIPEHEDLSENTHIRLLLVGILVTALWSAYMPKWEDVKAHNSGYCWIIYWQVNPESAY